MLKWRRAHKIWHNVGFGNCDYAEHFLGITEFLGPDAGDCGGPLNRGGGTALYCVSSRKSDEFHWHLCSEHTRMVVGNDGIKLFVGRMARYLGGK